jgi:hypothetical protein
MADSADLVVLGAWFGTGQKGKILKLCTSRSMPCLNILIQGCKFTHSLYSPAVLQRLQYIFFYIQNFRFFVLILEHRLLERKQLHFYDIC